MCTRTIPGFVELANFVSKKVSQFVSKEDPFTAYDITKQLRDENPTVEFSRNDVKNVIHQMFKADQMFGYLRQSAMLKTGQSAFVYYHPSSDVSSHPAVGNGDTDNSDTDTDTDADPDPEPDQEEENVLEITKERRLNIPKRLLRQCGFYVGDRVYLSKTAPGNVVLSKNDNSADGVVAEYTVNTDGSIRVSQFNLIRKFGTSYQFYKVYKGDSSNAIDIEPVF